jgi:hypothetical protein
MRRFQARCRILAASMFYSETQVHVEGGTNEALYPVRQEGFDNNSHTPNRTATSATLNPSRSFISVSRFPPAHHDSRR